MMRRLLTAIVSLAVAGPIPLYGSPPPFQCTAFLLHRDQTVLVGKNLDWELGAGLLVTHPREPAAGRRYGSLTVNQFGADLPLGGLNEVGLIVEELSYAPTAHPGADGRPAVNEFSWIQLQLDRYATVEEVVAALDEVAIVRISFGLHYFVADRTGDAAVVEFLDGRTVIYRGGELPVPVLANDTYERSLGYLRRHAGFGGERRETDGPESPERFVRAARDVAAFGSGTVDGDPVAAAFAILDNVRQEDTQWSLVYDARRTAVYLRARGQEGTRRIACNELDLRAGGMRRGMAITDELSGVSTAAWTECTASIEQQLRDRVREALAWDPGEEGPGGRAGSVPSRRDSLQIRYLQNAGVSIRYGARSLLIDALFDITVGPGRPPRLHDHLPPDDLAALLEGRLTGCVDAVFATHDHDDHYDAAAAQRYCVHCSQTIQVLPAAIAPQTETAVAAVALEFGEMTSGATGPVRYTALGLRHSGGEGGRLNDRPHLGFVVHLGPYDILHLGDAAVSRENLELLDRFVSPGRRLVLAPYWFLTDAAGRAWLRERSSAQTIVLLHANRGNIEAIAETVAEHAPALPPLVLPRERLQRIVVSD
ncbi:MAG: linear amide C-N hydrolase [Candidatus Eisenbacteria bacterium]|nr:linear amide C-N hydrolase [Candidatus Eisenbacteria bacterium]